MDQAHAQPAGCLRARDVTAASAAVLPLYLARDRETLLRLTPAPWLLRQSYMQQQAAVAIQGSRIALALLRLHIKAAGAVQRLCCRVACLHVHCGSKAAQGMQYDMQGASTVPRDGGSLATEEQLVAPVPLIPPLQSQLARTAKQHLIPP